MSSISSQCNCWSPASLYNSSNMSPRSSSPTPSDDHKGDDHKGANIDLSVLSASDVQQRRLRGLYRRVITPNYSTRLRSLESQRTALKQELVELGATQNTSPSAQQRQIVQLKQQDLRRIEFQIQELEKAIKEYALLEAQAQARAQSA